MPFAVNPGPRLTSHRSASKAGAPRFNRAGSIGVIVALHLGLLYALQSGLAHKVVTRQSWPTMIFTTITALQPLHPTVPVITPQHPPAAPAAPAVINQSPLVADNAITSVSATNETVQEAAMLEATTPAIPIAPATPVPPVARADAAPAPAPLKTIDSGLEYLQAPQPEYPLLAKRMGEHGRVMLRVLVNASGHAERADVTQSSGSARLDQAARIAVLRALFKPVIEDGKAVAVLAMVPIIFELN
jgi:protein TonB